MHAAFVALLAMTGCAALGGGSDAEDSALRPAERKIVGAAQPYPADLSLRARTADLAGSMKARRAAAWKSLANVWRPVALAEQKVQVAGATPTLPLFRTWYGKDDYERVFGKMYAGLGPEGRKARRAFTPDLVTQAEDANAKDQGSFSDDDYAARVKGVSDQAFVDGLGGNARVAYSPGFVEHLLGQYANAYACLARLPTIDPLAPPASESNFAPCFAQEFPVAAALVKASWWRAEFGMKLPTHDTSAATLAARRAGTSDAGGWGAGEGEADPTGDEIYSIATSDGSRYRMAAMHLVTKELREWMWITAWWSPEPDTDFGADRPAEVRDLPGPWKNYKMCVVTAYEEGDADPTGGFDGTLGDSLAAVHEGKGGPTWCANPYLERGAKNAQTNCIGCHQHAGSAVVTGTEAVLAADARFPKSGRTKLRANFPADYVWSLTAKPELLIESIAQQIVHYDGVDR